MAAKFDNQFTRNVAKSKLKGSPTVEVGRPAFYKTDRMEAVKLSDHLIKYTTARAAAYLQLPAFTGERNVTESHVQRLLQVMERGHFNWDLVVIVTCLLDGVIYRINGQHTSWARMGLTDNPSPEVREILYEVKSRHQLRLLYGTFDRVKSRSNSHITRVGLVDGAAAAGMASWVVSRLSPGIRMWLFEGQQAYKAIEPDELGQLIEAEHATTFNVVGLFVQSLNDSAMPLIKRQPAMAAMCETFSRWPADSAVFWREVAEGVNLRPGDARLLLNRYLTRSAISRSGITSNKQIVDAEDMYRTCISAWNRWRAGGEVQALRSSATRVRAGGPRDDSAATAKADGA